EQGVEPAAIRLAILAHHYRGDWDWTDAVLREAEQRLARWRAATTGDRGPAAEPVLAAVRERLADDLDAPGALAAVDAWVAAAHAQGTDADGSSGTGAPLADGAPQLVRDAVDALLGVKLARSPSP
ncbi:MAG: hypothetical protein ACXV1K_06400, partial [Kineosporiaceae bacterium]